MAILMKFLKLLWRRLLENDSPGLAAEMTYNWMLSLLPALIFIFSLFGMFGVQSSLFEHFILRLHRLIPADAFNLLETYLRELTRDSSGSLALVSFAGALWTAANGAVTVEKALNRSYRCIEEPRNFWQKRATAMWIVVGMGFLLFVCANLLVFGEVLFQAIQHIFPLPQEMLRLLGYVRWVIPVFSLIVISAFIYYVAPGYKPERPRKRRIWRGAMAFVGIWIFVSWLFSLYVNNMGNYSRIYGSMGAVIILMVWLYITSFALIIGGEINAIFSDCMEPDIPPATQAPDLH